ncbi:MAG: BrnT family toxin [Roseovarius sp.]|uniref:BrnT family toxin n=1 Tax=Roseovarius sp. TaxID=1486281 RepID=UPI0040596088
MVRGELKGLCFVYTDRIYCWSGQASCETPGARRLNEWQSWRGFGMNFEWDEGKRLATIRKHRIDFADAVEVLHADPMILPARSDIEERFIAVGLLAGVLVAVIFTMRGNTVRLITARRARKDEQERYQTLHAGRGPRAQE